MGRVNSPTRLERARSMGCNSADGTFIKYRRRTRAGEHIGARDARGAPELRRYLYALDASPMLPTFGDFESPSLPVHKSAVAASANGGDTHGP